MTIKPSMGIALPGVVGGLVCWLPAAALGGNSALVVTLLLPAWTALLWWTFVAGCTVRTQRVGIPLASAAALWLLGPLVLGQALLSPLATFVLASYGGSIFGLLAATGLLFVLAAVGFGAGHPPVVPRQDSRH